MEISAAHRILCETKSNTCARIDKTDADRTKRGTHSNETEMDLCT